MNLKLILKNYWNPIASEIIPLNILLKLFTNTTEFNGFD